MNSNITALLPYGIIIGLGATVVFDLWGLLLKMIFKIQPSNICLVGRWFLYMKEGKFTHSNLGKAEPKKYECSAGWAAHYMIGSSLGIIFILLTGSAWAESPSVLPAILFGVFSVIAPLFIMQPAFGFGFAGSKTPNPLQTGLRSILNHTAFGFGLYFSALLLNLRY